MKINLSLVVCAPLPPSLPQISSLQSEHEEQEQTICQYEEELVQAREELLKLQEETRLLEEKVQAAREQLTPLQESVRDSYKQVTQVRHCCCFSPRIFYFEHLSLFIFQAFSRCFCPKQLSISTFV